MTPPDRAIALPKPIKPADGHSAGARVIRLPTPMQLNEREIEILTLVARGRTSTQIARQLKIVKRTVDFHISNARVKLQAANRTEAAIRAVAARLIEPY
jgi:DNA-binding NarL/FixJ family response regulator